MSKWLIRFQSEDDEGDFQVWNLVDRMTDGRRGIDVLTSIWSQTAKYPIEVWAFDKEPDIVIQPKGEKE